MASATFSGVRPPAATRCLRTSAFWKRFLAAWAQSNDGRCRRRLGVRESTRIASTFGVLRCVEPAAQPVSRPPKCMTRRMRKHGTEARAEFRRQIGRGSKWSCTPVRPLATTVDSISSNETSTKTPIFSIAAGRWGTIAATCSGVTRRGLGAKTNPTASAPASAASCASSSDVLPQILIQMFAGHRVAAAPAHSSASAAPGSGWRIRLSPIRKASNPAARRRAMFPA